MNINFIKMHVCGNDFLIIDIRKKSLQIKAEKVRELADYKRSVGFDQLIIIEESNIAYAAIRIFNGDGSEASACGNGTRCVASLLFQETPENTITIATTNRVLQASYIGRYVAINMGEAKFLKDNLDFADLPYGSLVEIGNMHVVIDISNLDWNDIENPNNDYILKYGEMIENDPRFPDKVNVNFIKVINQELVYLRTWERGVGVTLSCGTGACASFAFLHRAGLINKTAVVRQLGGEISILMSDKELVMSGEAEISYRGIIEI